MSSSSASRKSASPASAPTSVDDDKHRNGKLVNQLRRKIVLLEEKQANLIQTHNQEVRHHQVLYHIILEFL